MKNEPNCPIFVHSIFRSGSTYIFNVFRRSKYKYYSFKEPLHEVTFFSRKNSALLKVDNLKKSIKDLRHPEIGQDYFKEIIDLWPCWQHSVYESLIYDEYFLNLPTEQNTQFWKDLVAGTSTRAVFQECRTAGRIKLLREKIGGVHIYLWRNPWDQWWSYKVNNYFDAANRLILHSTYAPAAVQLMVDRLGLVKCNTKSISQSFEFYFKNPLSAEQSYQVFYMIWILGLHNGLDHCHIDLNIDRLSDDLAYKSRSLNTLNKLGISGINLDDCQVPRSIFTQNEKDFFKVNEKLVHKDLLNDHWLQADLKRLHQHRHSFEPIVWAGEHELSKDELTSQLGVARSTINKIETSYATIVKEINIKDQQAQAQLQAVYSSSSWRITAPLRWLKERVKATGIIWNQRQENKKYLKTILNKKNLPYRQLLVDISELIQQEHDTGIQRVTRFILKNWLLNPPSGFKIEPVYATVNKGYRYATVSKTLFLGGAIKFHPNGESINVNLGDIFLGLNLSHQIPLVHQTFLKYLHKNGIDVRFVVYDLLPIQFPDFFEKQHSVRSLKAKWLSFVTSLSGAICISKTVAKDLAEWVKNNSRASQRNFSINWFHLGADIDQSLPTNGLLQNEQLILDDLRSSTTFLMVGTLEPRKGHAQALDAFEKLWQEGADFKLIIVGKKGWLIDVLEDRLRKHKELGERLLWLESASDEFLTKIYANSTCLIAASYGEGFGLPLIEAARHKLPIICRDIPTFREVAGQHAFYFDASDAIGLSASIKQWLLLYEKTAHPTSDRMPWKTWSESAENLKHLLIGSTLDKIDFNNTSSIGIWKS